MFFVLVVPVDGDSGIYRMSPEEGRGVLGFKVRGGDAFGCRIAREGVILSFIVFHVVGTGMVCEGGSSVFGGSIFGIGIDYRDGVLGIL